MQATANCTISFVFCHISNQMQYNRNWHCRMWQIQYKSICGLQQICDHKLTVQSEHET